MSKLRVGILGAGNIANCMAKALNGITNEAVPYAVAARDLNRAKAFADKWNFEKAYGSYEELVNDENVDLIYVATPHSFHYEHAMLCVEHGKNVLCEKPFTVNEQLAKKLFAAAKEKNVFITEATWTRYLPIREDIKKAIADGEIGEVKSVFARFDQHLSSVQRMYDPALAGGSLLDLGIYCLTFASMYLGNDIDEVTSTCKKLDTGVDATDEFFYTYKDGKKAHFMTSFVEGDINYGVIEGTKGKIRCENLTNYSKVEVLDLNDKLIREIPIPPQVNGYEYEVLASKKAIEAGKLECDELPHDLTIEIIRQMDALRKEWGVVYPFE